MSDIKKSDINKPGTKKQTKDMRIEGIEYTKHLEIKDIGLDDEGCYSIFVDVAAIHLNREGFMHGGMISTLLDAVLGRTVISQIPKGYISPTVEMKVNFFRPATAGRLIAKGQIVNMSKTLAYAEGEIINDQGKLVARATGTFNVRLPKEPRA